MVGDRPDAPGRGIAGRILVVGRNSFLAQHVLAAMPAAEVTTIAHDEIDRPDLLEGVRAVLNFTRHPGIARDDYELSALDTDVRLARRLRKHEIAYVMLSSRKVYGPAEAPLAETAPTGPIDAYGRNRLAAEQELRRLLGERLTIIRLANIFGYERAPGRRTFLAMALERLAREGRIRYDMSPFVCRDFLPIERAAELLARIVAAPPGGILNVGSGIPLATGRIALWLLEGFGRGELVVASSEERDAFVLDVARLKALYGEPCSLEELCLRCREIGRRLADEVAEAQETVGT